MVPFTSSRGPLEPGYAVDMQIRPASHEDWTQIWPFFDDIVRDGRTYSYPDGLDSASAESLWMEAPPGLTVVAVDDGRVVGSAKMGPNRPGRGAHIATASFMVNPSAQGRGVGRALGEFAVDWARTSGFHGMQFNAVVETNTPAVELWKSLGFDVLATVPEAFQHATAGLVGLHIMYRKF
jgi:GNAT superfamily N-acetyltransferase